MLRLFPLDIFILIASKSDKNGIDILCQIHPEICGNQKFWERMYRINIRSPVPNDPKKIYLDFLQEYNIDMRPVVIVNPNEMCSDRLDYICKYNFGIYLHERLAVASKYGATSLVKSLFETCQKLDYLDKICVNNCLSFAIPKEYTDIVQILVKFSDWDKYNMLTIAVTNGNKDIVNLLISHGSNNYVEALDEATDCGHSEIMETILTAGENSLKLNHCVNAFCNLIRNDKIHHLKNNERNRRMARIILSSVKKHVTEMVDLKRLSEMCILFWLGEEEPTHQLLDQTSIINIMSINSGLIDTLVSMAACGGLISVIERLSKIISINPYSDNISLAGAIYGHIDVVQLALEHGASNYEEIIEAAEENGHQEIIDLFGRV